jgi:membrane fusion protein (multidrug efflux system)
MKKKYVFLSVGALVLFVAVIGAVKFFQIRAAMAQGASWSPPPEAVTTVTTRVDYWPKTLASVGSVTAVQGVTVSADLPGIVQKIAFESGRPVREGQVLVQLDASQERAQLAAADAQSELAKLNLDRSKKLLERQVIAQSEYDALAATAKEAEARQGEIRATIERKTIRAPFSGVLGIRQVNLGQYLNAGDPVVPLQSISPIYVNFSLPQQQVQTLRIGDAVRLSADGISIGDAQGRITAINSVVDVATRNAQVQATFANPHGRLRAGMYVDVQASFGGGDSVIALPASAVSFAPYGNSVFVVSQMKDPKTHKEYRGVEQRFVQVGPNRGDQVAIVSGLKPGEEVVSSGVFKLRSGAAVLVNNKISPSNNPAPKPEDS